MCNIGLHSAYLSVPIHPVDYKTTGLQFRDESLTYLVDHRIPIGCNKGPMICHCLNESVKRVMARKGFEGILAYLDDFLCVADSYEECCKMQHMLLSLWIKLGFQVSWKKVTGVSQIVECLGITIDTTSCCASLSEEKIRVLFSKLHSFQNKKRPSEKQLQCLIGSLNWACQVFHGGRVFLWCILDCICCLKESFH